ncbi:MAG: BREX-1 system adenine-specific DNA-methyltransferase PglX [bacterium]|nr:BREX-1 system adenine-specific DNA-methyltransferase PglX [bacterium]
MDKKMIKEFAVWARKKLISDITMKAALYGIRECATDDPLPQSTEQAQFFDIGAKEPVVIQGREIAMRRALVGKIHEKEKTAGYAAAFRAVMEEISYTWFNRLTAVRFMEASGYLPSGVRVLSSDDPGKLEPDMVTTPFETDMDFTDTERALVWKLKDENRQNALFRMLFIKQCNKLNEILPGLFEKSDDYSELLLEISFSDKEGIVYRLTHDIAEENFDAGKGGQVEIIGWLYQFYNSEPKDETYALLKKNVKVTKERLPAVTQLFTPDWIVRYMAENSLGRLWLEGHPNETLKSAWKYHLDEAKQEPEAAARLAALREERKNIRPEEIKLIDPCMGSGHILVYAFDLLMRIYESAGWSAKEAARGILENNLYGLDIDDRATQLAYFAVMMKARQYDRRIFSRGVQPNVYSIRESASVAEAYQDTADDFPLAQEDLETLAYLLKAFADAKEYGSIIKLEKRDYQSLAAAWREMPNVDSVSLWYDEIKKTVPQIIEQAIILTRKYDVVITNPPYMGGSGMNEKLSEYVKKNYPDSKSDLFAVFIEKCAELTRKGGYQAMITQHAWMFLSSYEKLRAKILTNNDIVNMAHLGPRAFEEIGGEVVQTTSFVTRESYTEGYAGRYVRLIEPSTQQGKEEMFLRGENRFSARQDNFSKIPGSPVAYWVSAQVIKSFNNRKLYNFGEAKQGLGTSDNKRFLRFWFETNFYNINFNILSCKETLNKKGKWFPYIKGGGFRRWYANKEYIVNYCNNGKEVKEAVLSKYKYLKSPDFVVKNTNVYFCKGITWSDVSTGLFSARYVENGYIFADAGPMFFSSNDNIMLGYFNSNVFQLFANIICQGLHYSTGHIPQIPFAQRIMTVYNVLISKHVDMNIKISKDDWDSFETSWDFKTHPLIAHDSDGRLATAFENWRDCAEKRFYQLKANEEELNRIFIDIYGLNDELTPEVEEKEVTVRKADLARDVKSLISYAVGCLFGRYSLDCEGLAYAGGEWKDSIYRRIIPDKDNCLPLTDEEYFHDDVVSLFCKWLAAAFGEKTLEENLDFVARALGGGGDSRRVIRGYFLKDFFKDHCKIYQKRPLYWLFDSGKENGFKALVYMHRWNADTIGNLRVEYLHPLQVKYENQIAIREQTIANAKEAREKTVAAKEMEKLKKQLKEIKDYDIKVAHLALSRITIDLDDGVKVNYEKAQTARDGKKLEVLAKI